MSGDRQSGNYYDGRSGFRARRGAGGGNRSPAYSPDRESYRRLLARSPSPKAVPVPAAPRISLCDKPLQRVITNTGPDIPSPKRTKHSDPYLLAAERTPDLYARQDRRQPTSAGPSSRYDLSPWRLEPKPIEIDLTDDSPRPSPSARSYPTKSRGLEVIKK